MSDLKDNQETKASKLKIWGAGIIILMIILMLFPINLTGRSAQEHAGGTLIGTASNGRKINSLDRQHAASVLEVLDTIVVQVPGEPQPMSLLRACWNDEIIRDFKANPDLFFLLIDESRRISPGMNPNVLGSLDVEEQSLDRLGLFNSGEVPVVSLHPLPSSRLAQLVANMPRAHAMLTVFTTQDGRYGQFLANTRPQREREAIYRAMSDFLSIQSAASLTLNATKPSEVMVDRQLASQYQTFTLQLASFDARTQEANVPEPTEAQLEAHLKTYAANPPGDLADDNLFGFGYRVPDRVKLQLLSFKRPDIRQFVLAEKTAYQWEVDARVDFQRHPERYTALTSPTTQPIDSATAPAAALPFDQVKEKAIETFQNRAIDARVSEIERRIRSTMSVDFQAWNTARITNQKAPTSSLGVAYDSIDYFAKLARDIEARFKITPFVEDHSQKPLSLTDLQLLTGFNVAKFTLPEALTSVMTSTNNTITGPEYATVFAAKLRSPREIEMMGEFALDTFEPSDPLTVERAGEVADIYFFRLTDVLPSEPATELAPVRNRIASDWKKAEAQRLSFEQATAAADTIRNTGEFNVTGASLHSVEVGYSLPAPAELGLLSNTYLLFMREVTDKLLGDQTQPVAALTVPLAQRTYVARRVALKPLWPDEAMLDQGRNEIRLILGMRMAQAKSPTNPFGLTSEDASSEWLDIKQIEKRNDWKPALTENATTQP